MLILAKLVEICLISESLLMSQSDISYARYDIVKYVKFDKLFTIWLLITICLIN